MNRQHLISILVLLILCLSDSVGAQNPAEFKDSSSLSPEVVAAVKQLTQAKILEGYPQNDFRAERPLTRYEFVVAIARLWKQTDAFSNEIQKGTTAALLTALYPTDDRWEFNSDDIAIDHPFKDVNPTHWAYAAQATCKDYGLLRYFPDGFYRGKRTVTRAELATFLARLLERKNTPLPLNIEHVRFADVDGDEWYFGAVLIAAGTGLMQGYPDHTFRPKQPVTRGEFAVALAKLLFDKR